MEDITNWRPRPTLIRELRELVPDRALTSSEAFTIAERQATTALKLLRITRPSVTLRWALQLPKVEVQLEPRHRMTGLAGMSTWSKGRYLVIINKNDAHGRRRFTLAHELKHVLDYTLHGTIYAGLGRGNEAKQQRRVEQIADHFAACLLMPGMWVKRAWSNGIQDSESLAGLFSVTEAAMQVRLGYLGLLEDNRPREVFFRRITLPTMGRLAGEEYAYDLT